MTSLKKISDYAYEARYDSIDYRYANARMDEPTGYCSSVRNGNFYGRNLDWTYDNKVSFVIHTKRNNGHYATLGVGGLVGSLTKEFVESGAWSDDYLFLPFCMLDGINECGVFCNTNVAPLGESSTFVPTGEVKKILNTRTVVRYVIDNFSTAKEAVEYITKHVGLYLSQELVNLGYSAHYMIGDKDNTYILELTDDGYAVREDVNYMFNFPVTGVEFNEDGTVYTPATQTDEYNAYDTNHINKKGAGLERHNLVVGLYDDTNTALGMRYALNRLNYTNTYKDTEPYWFTEFCTDGLYVYSDVSEFSEDVDLAKNAYERRDRNYPLTWQTVHSSVYNIESKTLSCVFQENGVEKTFSLVEETEKGSKGMIALHVNGQNLTVTQPLIAGGTIAYLEAEAHFSSDWDGLVKVLHLRKGDDFADIILEDDKVTKDKQMNLGAGYWDVWLTGLEADENGELVERITTDVEEIHVKLSGETSSVPPTPSEVEQLILKVENLRYIDHVVQNEDYTLTIVFTDGTTFTTTPIRGEKGDVNFTKLQLDAEDGNLYLLYLHDPDPEFDITGDGILEVEISYE